MSCDRAGSNLAAHASVLTPDRPSTGDRSDIESEYTAHRAAVLAMLRADFPRLRDPEELYQEAWAELLTIEARGETVVHRRALLKKIAWRRAADIARRARPEPIDPTGHQAVAQPDGAPPVDESAITRIDATVLRMVIDTLEPRQAAALKLRFDLQLSGAEIQEYLGVSARRLEFIVTDAYRNVLEQVQADPGSPSRWERRQRSLLLACEMGIASPAQRARARRMLERDPNCRAMLRAMRATLRDIAALLPLPPGALADRHRGGLIDWVVSRIDHVLVPFRGSGGSATIARAQALPEQATAGALGGLGIGGALKVAVVCLAVGAAGTACIDGGGLRDGPAKPNPARHPVTSVAAVPSHTTPTVSARPVKTSTARTSTHAPSVAVSSPAATPPASPAPAGSSEFGVSGPARGGAQAVAAVAPANGGGEFTP